MRRRTSWIEAHLMRVFDVVVASLLIVFAAPLLIAIALIVMAQDGGPAFFAQERIGRGGRRFRCYKFRTMAVDAPQRLSALLATSAAAKEEWARDHKLKHDPRITRLGHFFRKSSLDELPQLFNILRGEMSLVGPRPIVPEEIERYGIHFRHYCAVGPGLTGLWQVSGRNDIDYRKRIVMDVAYARHKCLTFDLAILLKTIPAVLLRRGSY